jgi:hypothetical protein
MLNILSNLLTSGKEKNKTERQGVILECVSSGYNEVTVMVPSDWNHEQIISFVNRKNPFGTRKGYEPVGGRVPSFASGFVTVKLRAKHSSANTSETSVTKSHK